MDVRRAFTLWKWVTDDRTFARCDRKPRAARKPVETEERCPLVKLKMTKHTLRHP